MPGLLLSQWAFSKGCSVSPCCVTRYCSGERRDTASGFLRYSDMCLPPSVTRPQALVAASHDAAISAFHERGPGGRCGNITGHDADQAGAPSYLSCRRLELRIIFSTQEN